MFPFKYENPELLVRNVGIAAQHPRVSRVLGVGFEEERTFRTLSTEAPAIGQATGTPIEVILQDRIGIVRPGKGDAMITALLRFGDMSEPDRIHFYDADISSFDASWITKAEDAADQGYDVVRHYFPRAATDAMITWLVTRVGFALMWPHSSLPWIEQPLGGELLLNRTAVQRLTSDPAVLARSDWGIDTMLTFSSVRQELRLFEVYIPHGKAHKLYGRLTDLRLMLTECFSALQSLRGQEVPDSTVHRIEYPDVVPHEIAEKVGYDIEGSLDLLSEGWTDRQLALLGLFPEGVREGLSACREYPRVGFMGEEAWCESMRLLLGNFIPGDSDWEELLFKLWTARVLAYTFGAAIRGYGYAHRYLHAMVYRTLARANPRHETLRSKATRPEPLLPDSPTIRGQGNEVQA